MRYTSASSSLGTLSIASALGCAMIAVATNANAQIRTINPVSADAAKQPSMEAIFLPDAPSTSLGLGDVPTALSYASETAATRRIPVRLISAPKYANVIEPEYQSQRLHGFSKSAYGMRELFSYHYPVAVLISAGLSHGADSDPLYGKDRNAFAQRVGAAGARQASQIVFSDVVMAPLLHEDPRYYVMGSGHSMFKRAGYAATRVLITHTDSGRTTPNLALLAGYGGSAALTQLYYPARSRDMNTVLSGYGLSLGGRAIGYELAEFFRFFGSNQPHQAYGVPR